MASNIIQPSVLMGEPCQGHSYVHAVHTQEWLDGLLNQCVWGSLSLVLLAVQTIEQISVFHLLPLIVFIPPGSRHSALQTYTDLFRLLSH